MMPYCHFVFSIFFLCFHGIFGQDKCGDVGVVSGVIRIKDVLEDNVGYGYIITSDKYTIKCCGVGKHWRFYAGRAGDVILQVWRPTGDDKHFQLIGQKKVTVPADEVRTVESFTYSDPSVGILVETGDVIGWYSPQEDMISYDIEEGDGVLRAKVNEPSLNTILDFSPVSPIDQRVYGVGLRVTKGSPPKFTALNRKMIKMDTPVGTVVHTVNVSDPDGDLRTVEMKTTSEFFSFNENTREILVKSPLEVEPPSDVFTLDFEATDRCALDGKASLQIKVDYVAPPTSKPPQTTKTTRITTTSPTTKAATVQVKTTPRPKETTRLTQPVPVVTKKTTSRPTSKTTKAPVLPTKKPVPAVPTKKPAEGQPVKREKDDEDELLAFKATDWVVAVVVVGVVVVGTALGLTVYEVFRYYRRRRGTVPKSSESTKPNAAQNGNPPIQKGI